MGAAGFQKGGEAVARKRTREAEDFRLDPEARMCPKFDAVSVAKFPVAPRKKWASGWRTTARKSISCDIARRDVLTEFRRNPVLRRGARKGLSHIQLHRKNGRGSQNEF